MMIIPLLKAPSICIKLHILKRYKAKVQPWHIMPRAEDEKCQMWMKGLSDEVLSLGK